MTNKGSLDMKLVMKQCCIICPHSNRITLSVLPVYMLIFRINLYDFVYWPQNLGWNGSLEPLRSIFYYHSCNVIFFFAIPLQFKKLFKIINVFNLPIFIARSSVALCMNLYMHEEVYPEP